MIATTASMDVARCRAGVVLLTPAVLARPKWVLKEAIILGWRQDLEPRFSLYFALSRTRRGIIHGRWLMSATQFLPGTLADLARVDEFVTALHACLPKVQVPTPFDNLVSELKKLFLLADCGETRAAW